MFCVLEKYIKAPKGKGKEKGWFHLFEKAQSGWQISWFPLLSYRNHDTQAPVNCVGTHTYTHLGIHEIKIRIRSGNIVSGERIDIFIIKVLEYFILIQNFVF